MTITAVLPGARHAAGPPAAVPARPVAEPGDGSADLPGEVTAELDAITDALARLRDFPWWRLTDSSVLAAAVNVEQVLRRGYGVQIRLAAETAERGLAENLGQRSPAQLLAGLLRIPVGQARARIDAARAGLGVDTVSGEHAEPTLPQLAVAIDAGVISGEHAAVITATKIPLGVDHDTRALCHGLLLDEAAQRDPVALKKISEQIRLICNPDGPGPGPDPVDRAELHIGVLRPDGLTPISGLLDPLTVEQLRVAIEALAAPRPIDEKTPDRRSAPLRRAHALTEILTRYHAAGSQPADGGARPVVAITIPATSILGHHILTRPSTPDRTTDAVIVSRTDSTTHNRNPADSRGAGESTITVRPRSLGPPRDHNRDPAASGPGSHGGRESDDHGGHLPGRSSREHHPPGQPREPHSPEPHPLGRCDHGRGPATGGPGGRIPDQYSDRISGQFDYGNPASAQIARMLACDSVIIRQIIDDQGAILDQGRGVRLFTRAQRRALITRDKGCAFPGCDIPAGWCEAHHITYWTNGGPTNLANAVLLCRHHHTVIHQNHWIIQPATSTTRSRPDPASSTLQPTPDRAGETNRDPAGTTPATTTNPDRTQPPRPLSPPGFGGGRGRPWFIPPPHIDPTRKPRHNNHFHLPAPQHTQPPH